MYFIIGENTFVHTNGNNADLVLTVKKNNVTIIGRNETTLPTPAKIPSIIRE